jgi:hypothetical protein
MRIRLATQSITGGSNGRIVLPFGSPPHIKTQFRAKNPPVARMAEIRTGNLTTPRSGWAYSVENSPLLCPKSARKK